MEPVDVSWISIARRDSEFVRGTVTALNRRGQHARGGEGRFARTRLAHQPNREATLGRSGFEVKKRVYADSQLETTRELAEKPSWDRKAIDHRQALMAKLATQAWRFQ